uniref:7TM_GPCR_Srx domain-containing protein n=1 Tax=Steinernema glaseri TaxID=37863 RepID=A0A1I7Z8P8_9BILA
MVIQRPRENEKESRATLSRTHSSISFLFTQRRSDWGSIIPKQKLFNRPLIDSSVYLNHAPTEMLLIVAGANIYFLSAHYYVLDPVVQRHTSPTQSSRRIASSEAQSSTVMVKAELNYVPITTLA